MIPEASGELRNMLSTVLTNKSIIAFAVEVFSNHPVCTGFGLLLETGLHIRSYNIHRQSDYFRFLLHPFRESERGFDLAAVHRHYTIGHRFSVLCIHCTALPQASSPRGWFLFSKIR